MSDNETLTVKRPKRVRETSEYAGFVRRAIRAFSRRVGEQGDVEALADMVATARELDQAITEAVKGLHQFGYSYAEIGQRLGISRQAVQQRWGK